METLVKAKVFATDGKPICNASVQIQYLDNNDISHHEYTSLESIYYTDINGIAEFIYKADEGKNKHYTIKVIESDSSGPSFDSEYIKPGFPKFYNQKVEKRIYFPVLLRHSNAYSKNEIQVYTTSTDLKGGKMYNYSFDLERYKDTLINVPALYNNILRVSYNCTYTNSADGYWFQKNYFMDPINMPASNTIIDY